MLRILPTIDGYTIDERLREFRRFEPPHGEIEFVPFDSPKGRELREKYRRSLES